MDDLKEEVEAFLKSQVRVTFRGKNIFDAREVQPFDTTKYWNSHLIPQEFNETILEDITLDESTKYIIKIEGISDEGQPVSKQIYY